MRLSKRFDRHATNRPAADRGSALVSPVAEEVSVVGGEVASNESQELSQSELDERAGIEVFEETGFEVGDCIEWGGDSQIVEIRMDRAGCVEIVLNDVDTGRQEIISLDALIRCRSDRDSW